ncbi:RING-H2 finger protein ATL63-like [Pyrus ussuriensis x Pyrus communis]|uniref:RING-H2 finger protein ATL63-like n=1 Tax=Pyrus ussuriensis x Pyrus communis TaxID=2448454 RepID=A0A5N5F419_9ROSA|nr:RING-H2 finger protein ATL63-like [Pyrus ussuriensis x Pyrus communis]
MGRPRNLLSKLLLVLLDLLNMIKLHYCLLIKQRHQQFNKLHIYEHRPLENDSFPPPPPQAETPSWRPSPWLVPVPVHCIAESVKNQLPVLQYQETLMKTRRQAEAEEQDCHVNMCIVCMDSMEEGQAVREPCNCSHGFHKECLDVWIDQGQLTCPLCRSELLPKTCSTSPNSKDKDPWRKERMVYLFGDDYFMS